MQHSHAGSLVAVTLTRDVRPDAERAAWIPAHQVPTGVSLSTSPVRSFLAAEHRQIAQSFYRRPGRGR
ncbi:MAG: hypothetical protein HOP18_02910 [Deltaproteobacteria bacterium]|nr:hypothetical protein [Deltaproteobacteria bacterium]